MGVGRVGKSPCPPPDIEIYHILLFSCFRVGKIKLHNFWPPMEKNFGYPWKNPLLTPPGKIHSDIHGGITVDPPTT